MNTNRRSIRQERRSQRRILRDFDHRGQAPLPRVRRQEPSHIYADRAAAIVPKTLDRETRSIRATCSTDYPVRIYDWGSDTIVDEVLIPSGMRVESDWIQLLLAHDHQNPMAVLGSVDGFTRAGSVEGRLVFSNAPDVEPIYMRVAEGHLRNVSVGAQYTRNDYIEILPGKSRAMGGVSYTATDVPMRLVKRWILREVSLVVFGADPQARVRDSRSDSRGKMQPTRRVV